MLRILKSCKSVAFILCRTSWRLGLFCLKVAAILSEDKPTRPRYTALQAQALHDEGLIGDEEYAKAVYSGE